MQLFRHTDSSATRQTSSGTEARDIRRVLLKLALVLIPPLLLIVAVNCIGDPGELFCRRGALQREIVALLLQGRNVLLGAHPSDWGGLQGAVIRGFAAKKRSPSVVVWGTSRSAEICQEHFPQLSFFNHVVLGGSVADYVALYEIYMEETGKVPRCVIIAIDPVTFCARTPREVNRHLYHIPNPACPPVVKHDLGREWAAGMRRLGLGNPPNPWGSSSAVTLHRLANMVSLTYFQSALHNIAVPRPRPTELSEQSGALILRRDGSYTVCPDPSKVSAEEVAVWARTFAQAASFRILDAGVVRGDAWEVFDRLILALLRQDCRVVLYLSPIHADAYDALPALERMALEKRLRELCATRGLTMVGSFDPHRYGLESAQPWFFDEHHPMRQAVDRILEAHASELKRVAGDPDL